MLSVHIDKIYIVVADWYFIPYNFSKLLLIDIAIKWNNISLYSTRRDAQQICCVCFWLRFHCVHIFWGMDCLLETREHGESGLHGHDSVKAYCTKVNWSFSCRCQTDSDCLEKIFIAAIIWILWTSSDTMFFVPSDPFVYIQHDWT